MIQDANVLPPDCDQDAGECGQSFWIVSLYFVVFVSLQSILLINLFSTIILHHFEALQVCSFVKSDALIR